MDGIAPLAGIVVVDIGFGHAAALIAKFLAEAGARVVRFEPVGGDPFRAIYPAHGAWRRTLAEVRHAEREAFGRLIGSADVLISGGEMIEGASFGELFGGIAWPGRLIRVEIAPGLPHGPFAGGDGADLLIQAETGMLFEMLAYGPLPIAISPSACGALFQGLTGLCAALLMRERSGRGQCVAVGLAEAAITMMAPLWSSAEVEPPWFQFRVPKVAPPLIFECADGGLIHIVLGTPGSKYKLYRLLDIDDPAVEPTDAGLPNPANPPSQFYGDVDRLAPRVASWRRDELLEALSAEGIVAGRVLGPGAVWDEPQVLNNGIIAMAPDGSRFVGQPIRWTSAPGAEGSVASSPTSTSLPLAGVRVIDFGAFVAGPSASVGLADLGAEVVKVEPITGDSLRPAYPFFAAANRGKQSIALDLKSQEGLKIAAELARSADVVCSNFKVGVAERLGIDAGTLHQDDPTKIVLLNSGYGLSGPLMAQPAFDPVMQAECGIEARSGGEGNAPLLNSAAVVDFSGGYLGQIGVLMGLYYRARHGRGVAVEVPLLNAALFLVSDVVKRADGGLEGPLALAHDRMGFSATERVYRASDGWIAVSARTDEQATRLAEVLGIDRPGSAGRGHWTGADVRAADDFCAAVSADDLLGLLSAAAIPVARCREDGRASVLASEELVRSGTLFVADRPKLGTVRGPGIAYRSSEISGLPVGSLPALGEHGPRILAELGYSPQDIEQLQLDGIMLVA